VIQLRHRQPSLWHSGLAKDIEDLWEPWMKEVDQLLEDATLVESVYDAQGKRHSKSRTRGRTQTPAEVALRLLILKHVRNWSYDTLEREVRANLVPIGVTSPAPPEPQARPAASQPNSPPEPPPSTSPREPSRDPPGGSSAIPAASAQTANFFRINTYTPACIC
jgi:hypothetical protein